MKFLEEAASIVISIPEDKWNDTSPDFVDRDFIDDNVETLRYLFPETDYKKEDLGKGAEWPVLVLVIGSIVVSGKKIDEGVEGWVNIANKLKKVGYTNVQNLYGGIFEWKNNHLPVVNAVGKPTDSIHAYSKQWGKYLQNGIKVYD